MAFCHVCLQAKASGRRLRRDSPRHAGAHRTRHAMAGLGIPVKLLHEAQPPHIGLRSFHVSREAPEGGFLVI